jgi:hypothetical protein
MASMSRIGELAKMATDYVSLKVTSIARHAVQQLTLTQSAQVGRRLSMSDVLVAMAAVAGRHQDELMAELTGGESQ